MPELTALKGLVLHETAYSESDKIIELLTESGVRTVRVRGARKPQSKYAAVTQLFAYGEFCLRETKEKYYLDSAISLNLFYPLRTDLDALALGAYFADIVRRTATEQHQPEILRLFLICLHYLSEKLRPLPQIKAVFELRLLSDIGMMPNLICCPVCMQYMPLHPILRIEKADLVCAECYGMPGLHDLGITQATLMAVRHVVYSELDRVLCFRVRGAALRQFIVYAEKYVQYRLGYRPDALMYFYDVVNPPVDDVGEV